MKQCDVLVIGAGITGLTCAFQLKRKQVDVQVLECQDRIGGQIHTITTGDFVFESGPNTGVIKYPEVAELFEELGELCKIETALESSKKRMIWKRDKFHALPDSPWTAITTPLFTWKDKLRILGEPWRAKGTDPDESVGSLAERRLGKSFVDYAVDPFLSGVYASDPYTLPTRLALPKLYALEQDYGSFVRGALAKRKLPKTPRDKKATSQVFSAQGGFSNLVYALGQAIGDTHITTSATQISVQPSQDRWIVSYSLRGEKQQIEAQRLITTCGAYALPELLPFVPAHQMSHLSSLYYAPIVQVGVALKDTQGLDWKAFGGLVPSCEDESVLGILFPSSCFASRCPDGGAVMSYFLGGVRHPEMVLMSDQEIEDIVQHQLHHMLKYPSSVHGEIIHIFRHPRAIPQYEKSTDLRLAAVKSLQQQYPTLIIAGNLRDGIGIADRIKQAFDVAATISSPR